MVWFLTLFCIGLVYGQQTQCIYDGPTSAYFLNLTRISSWTFEYETPNHFYYYSPCRNAIPCNQGNANFQNNVAQYTQGANQCDHYLSVDNGQKPTYSYSGATWIFQYTDGEMCDQTQQPRKTTIFYHCDEEASNTFLYNVEERQLCNYVLNMHSPEACVPENSHNAACQWKISAKTGDTYYLDLSALKGELIKTTNSSQNGYNFHYSPCQNLLHCYQQTGGYINVMMDIYNQQTSTCEHINAIWEDGRVQPQWNYDQDMDTYYYSFHYYNGEKCSNGDDDVTHVNWWCDPSEPDYKIVNATEPSSCHFEINIASASACNATAEIKY